MNYIAHCDGEREQSILEHLQGTAEKAKDFAEVFEKGDWGYCCGMLHDIGKYSDKFQRRIRGEEIKVDHATAGARVCMELGGMYPFLEMCIAGHHAGLSDYGVSTDTGNSSTTLGRRKKKMQTVTRYFEMLYHMRGESLDKKKICEEFNGGWHHFATVEREFKLIDENTVTVFVNQEEDAQEVIQDLKNKGFTKSGMRRAVQYCVNLYKQEFEKYNDAGMLKLVSEDIKDFYELTDLEQYSEETGLNLEVDCGMAVWL